MQPSTRQVWNNYMKAYAQAIGNPNVVRNETAHYPPLAQQKTFLRVAERAEFLKNVNHIPVTAQLGQRVGVGVSQPLASRTNTDIEERRTREIADLQGDEYRCMQTNTDTHISYRTLDSWAHMDNFQKTYNGSLSLQKARDRLMIGFNGETAAPVTDKTANPLLQDVNIGWLAKVRNSEPSRILGYDSDGAATTDTYKVGEGGNYKTLDKPRLL